MNDLKFLCEAAWEIIQERQNDAFVWEIHSTAEYLKDTCYSVKDRLYSKGKPFQSVPVTCYCCNCPTLMETDL